MHFIHLPLHRGGAINATAHGCFSGNKAQEIIVARGNAIELLRIEGSDMPKIISISVQPAFCVVRSLAAFRLTGSTKDYCAVGSDSGKITILEFSKESGDMKVVHCEGFGKTGCRRIVPGELICSDPQGRALMIAGLEKQKLVYVMNRDVSNRLTISSPLEAHKSQAICYAICALDVGFDNPVFASIEIEYAEVDTDSTDEALSNAEKHLVYYQLDLGLIHVTRMWSEPISRTACNILLSVPGGTLGPSGVLICAENWIAYRHQGHDEVRTAIPRRKGTPSSRGILITSGALYRSKEMFFFIVQSELGDLYKVTFELDATRKVVIDIIVAVFDTIPVAKSLILTRKGMLFCAAEASNHMLFNISSLDDSNSQAISHKVDNNDEQIGDVIDDYFIQANIAPTFEPSPTLLHLDQTDEVESLSPITQMLIGDYCNEGTPQLYTACGQGVRSSLRILRHGLSVTEIAVSDLPGRPSAVWSVQHQVKSSLLNDELPLTKYLVVSFTNATLVLSVGDTVEEISAQDSGFLCTTNTLAVKLLDNGSVLQVHSNGLRVISNGRAPQEWRTPGKKVIEKACANTRQCVISLAGGELIYFKLDDTSNMLQEMGTKELGVEISCIEIGDIPIGRVSSMYLAIGDWSGTVKILSLHTDTMLVQLSIMDLPVSPSSLCLVSMQSIDQSTTVSKSATSSLLYLYVGLSNGIMQRVAVDSTSGAMSDARTRFLGAKPVKLFKLSLPSVSGSTSQNDNSTSVLALSSRSWLSYTYRGKHITTPLSYEELEYAGEFCTSHCPYGIVAISDTYLRIIAVEQKGDQSSFNQQIIPLRYTPRSIIHLESHDDSNVLLTIESDADEYNMQEKEMLKQQESHDDENMITSDNVNGSDNMDIVKKSASSDVVKDENNSDEEEEDEGDILMPIKGPLPPLPYGKWASCIRLIDPKTATTLECLELCNNDAAFSVCSVVFNNRGNERFICIGISRGMTFHPRSHDGCSINTYRILDNRLVLLHTTEVHDVPSAMTEYQGRLLVGVGNCIRLYDLGKRKLLLKCELKGLPTVVVSLAVNGDRVCVCDMIESCIFIKYRRMDNQFIIQADDQVPRQMLRSCLLDYDTTAGSDKFGNFFVLRVPESANDDVMNSNPVGTRVLWDSHTNSSYGATNKLEQLAQFYHGEVITSLNKTSLVPAGAQVVLYSTINGSIGAFLPFSSKDDVDFFSLLEMHMRQEVPTLCGRDHTSYRSYFLPVKSVVDGELCELYVTLPYELQKKVASGLDRSISEVLKKLEDMRNRLL